MRELKLDSLRIDGGTQCRVAMSQDAIQEYAEALTDGSELPPIDVYFDGAEYWVVDGLHRYHAHRRIGALSIMANVTTGTLEDAVFAACGKNRGHGLRRTNADKRKAVEMAIAIRPDWSDRAIAKHVGVDHKLVAAVRDPRAAERQQQNRDKSAAKKLGSDPAVAGMGSDPRPRVESDPAPRPEQLPTSVSSDNERDDVLAELAEEVERLTDRLAVEAMDATEDEKALAAETIAQLRAEVASLQAQLKAAHGVRDQLMAENAQLKRQCVSQQRQIKKLEGGK